MLPEIVNLIITIFAAVMGGLSLCLVWVYVIEIARGVEIEGYSEYKKYVNTGYLFFLLFALFVWLTTTTSDQMLWVLFASLAALWTMTAVLVMVIAAALKGNVEGRKKNLRATFAGNLFKGLVAMIILVFIS